MRRYLTITLLLVLAACTASQTPSPAPTSTPDPVGLWLDRLEEYTSCRQEVDPDSTFRITNYDVQMTESLVSPLVGTAYIDIDGPASAGSHELWGVYQGGAWEIEKVGNVWLDQCR